MGTLPHKGGQNGDIYSFGDRFEPKNRMLLWKLLILNSKHFFDVFKRFSIIIKINRYLEE